MLQSLPNHNKLKRTRVERFRGVPIPDEEIVLNGFVDDREPVSHHKLADESGVKITKKYSMIIPNTRKCIETIVILGYKISI